MVVFQDKKIHIFERLAYADTFERFLGNKYNTAKRFGLDGAEAVIPGTTYPPTMTCRPAWLTMQGCGQDQQVIAWLLLCSHTM